MCILFSAMMSMEEEKMASAKAGLEEVEKKCRVSNSIFKVKCDHLTILLQYQ